MNLKQNILNNDKQTAPDYSGSHEVMKVIFSRHSKATAGSFCNGFRKKTFRTRAIAQSWNRLKKNKVIVKVHCTEHEYGKVNVTLWEDDAKGKGHNKINEKNFAQTKPAEVKRGIAETKFVLSPSFAKMAEAQKAKGDSSEGKTHEYYVTATIKTKTMLVTI